MFEQGGFSNGGEWADVILRSAQYQENQCKIVAIRR